MYAFKQQPDRNNFGPRLVLLQPEVGQRFLGDGATVFRGGYGIYYDGLFTNIVDNTAATSPNALVAASWAEMAAAKPMPRNNWAISSALQAPRRSLTRYRTNSLILIRSNGISTSSASCREIDSHRSLRRHTWRKLFVNQDFNGASASIPDGTYARLNPNFNEIVVRNNAASSWYNAAQLELDVLSLELLDAASYTWSHLTDDASEVFTHHRRQFLRPEPRMPEMRLGQFRPRSAPALVDRRPVGRCLIARLIGF